MPRWLRYGLIATAVLVAGLTLRTFWPLAPVPLQVSPETTLYTSPLLPSGAVDTAAAFNAEVAGALPPGENLALLLLELMGPEGVGELEREAVVAALDLTWATPPAFMRIANFGEVEGGAGCSPRENAELRLPSLSWQRAEHPGIAAWLDHNADAIDRLVAGGDRVTHFFVPVVYVDDVLLCFPQVAGALDLFDALGARVWLAVGEGRKDDAVRDASALLRLSRAATRCPYGGALGQAVRRTANQMLMRLALWPEMDERLLIELLQDVQQAPAAQDFTAGFVREVRLTHVHGLTRLFADPQQLVEFDRLIDVNVLLQSINSRTECALAALREPDPADRLEAWAREVARWRATARRMSPPPGRALLLWRAAVLGPLAWREHATATADFAHVQVLFAVDNSPRVDLAAATADRVAEATLAIAAYRTGHGRYPTGLDELVPRLLIDVPTDLPTGDRLRYSTGKDTCELRASGPDGIWNTRDDLVWPTAE